MKTIALLLVLFASTTSAASFECSKAKTAVEKKICSSAKLSSLDDKLAETYEIELQRDSRESLVRKAQKLWLDERNKCSDLICLELKYEQRIAELACDEDSRMAGSAIGSNLCSHFQTRLLERQLKLLQEKFVSETLKTSNNPEYAKRVLREEEVAWRVYRDAQCALRGETEGGSDGWKNAFGGMCVLDETKKRITSLSGYAIDK